MVSNALLLSSTLGFLAGPLPSLRSIDSPLNALTASDGLSLMPSQNSDYCLRVRESVQVFEAP